VIGDAAAADPSAFARIARALPSRGVPILVRAEGEGDTERLPALQRHANEAIVKPWHVIEDLRALVARAVHGAVPMSAKRGHARIPIDPALAGKTVLVVDDDARNILALTGLAERSRMRVVAARSGAEALELLKATRRIDLILCDIMMPEMDGLATIRAIRAMGHHRSTPIVAVTAKALKGDRETCLQAGASDFVAKPVDPDQLYSVMRVLLAD
jgi:CheY-like chemotaxis protein